MEQKNKIALGAVIVVGILAIGGIFYYRSHRAAPPDQALQGNAPIATGTAASDTTSATKPAGIASDVNKSLSYAQAVAVYDRTRVQFDPNCQMLPAAPVYPNGTTVMFDNRSPNGRYFRLDGVRYYLKGYEFRLLKLTAQKLPHVVDVDCGTGQNNGKITLE